MQQQQQQHSHRTDLFQDKLRLLGNPDQGWGCSHMGTWGFPTPPAPENSVIRSGVSVVSSIGNPPPPSNTSTGSIHDSVKKGEPVDYFL